MGKMERGAGFGKASCNTRFATTRVKWKLCSRFCALRAICLFRDDMGKMESEMFAPHQWLCAWFRDDMGKMERTFSKPLSLVAVKFRDNMGKMEMGKVGSIIYRDGAELISAPKLTLTLRRVERRWQRFGVASLRTLTRWRALTWTKR